MPKELPKYKSVKTVEIVVKTRYSRRISGAISLFSSKLSEFLNNSVSSQKEA